jgi:hypothetical protein
MDTTYRRGGARQPAGANGMQKIEQGACRRPERSARGFRLAAVTPRDTFGPAISGVFGCNGVRCLSRREGKPFGAGSQSSRTSNRHSTRDVAGLQCRASPQAVVQQRAQRKPLRRASGAVSRPQRREQRMQPGAQNTLRLCAWTWVRDLIAVACRMMTQCANDTATCRARSLQRGLFDAKSDTSMHGHGIGKGAGRERAAFAQRALTRHREHAAQRSGRGQSSGARRGVLQSTLTTGYTGIVTEGSPSSRLENAFAVRAWA